MSQLNIFCFGFGQVAKSFIKKIKDEKIKFKFSTTSREESKIKTFEGVSYQSFKFNEEKFDNNLLKNLKEADYILVSIAPINRDIWTICFQLFTNGVQEFFVLLIDRAFSTEVIVVLCNLKHSFSWNITTAEDIFKKWDNILWTIRATKRNKQYCIVQG